MNLDKVDGPEHENRIIFGFGVFCCDFFGDMSCANKKLNYIQYMIIDKNHDQE